MSEIRVTTISDTAGTGPVTLTKQSAAKAWFNLKTTTSTVLNDSLNVSNVVDLGTGETQVNLTSAMSNAFHSISGVSGRSGSGSNPVTWIYGMTSSNWQHETINTSGTYVDQEDNCGQTAGDLA